MTKHISAMVLPSLLVLLLSLGSHLAAQAATGKLVEVATSTQRWTGVAVSQRGRVFVSFPRWSPDVLVSVGELMTDGTVRPYPDEELNDWPGGDDGGESDGDAAQEPDSKLRFACVQSVYVDAKNRLWILDPTNPMIPGKTPESAKLIRVDLETNTTAHVYSFDAEVAPRGSYLNDVRVDTENETAFLTDSGLGALVVVDLATGRSRRVLADHLSTKAEDVTVKVGGHPFPMQVHADGIALDAEGGWLYYQALTGRTLYRVPIAALRDDSLPAEKLAAQVERYADSGVSDGLLYTPAGIYISALEDNSIKLVDSDRQVRTVITDERILWPDSFAQGPDGSIWFTTSLIHLGPQPDTLFRIFRIEFAESLGAPGRPTKP